jgi:hypothetical protein
MNLRGYPKVFLGGKRKMEVVGGGLAPSLGWSLRWRAAIFMALRPASSASATVANVSDDGSAQFSKWG